MMRVGVLKVDLQITDSLSLKDKRVVLRRIKDRIRNAFNVSVAEVEHNEKWQMSSLGVACVSNDKRHVDTILNKVKNIVEKDRCIIVVNSHMEIV
jgi:uncharacterized protein YlxP (DUF503 family)